ncbi:hypothetical protein OAU56_02285 [Nitrosopumilus sp.]|jgi:hypothetical protein|nr:hypothetical protein [Nitrosopumilus sp.]MDC3292037.1 hypothetical protein [Nitrosopumilus sp.]MDO7697778.1 hypothetical protein [Nitrosopumilus sp.]|tara:strand:+ start:149 stop:565 length:417 start_codon:yes stop_codon:yes gene_type:complete
MPLDKIENIEEYVKTHESLVLHIKNNPVGCIIEENNENKSKYSLVEKKSEVKASIRGFLNKHEDAGLLMGFKFKIQINNEILEYTSYPNEEFIEAIILNEIIFVIDNKMKQMFSCKISTDQFVKTKSELNKFQKILNK